MRAFLQNTLLIGLSCLVALVLVEIALRLAGQSPGNPFERLLNNPDDLVGYRMIPGAKEDIAGPAGIYKVAIVPVERDTGRGFRDDGFDNTSADSLFFGDSFVFGFGVELSDSVSEQYQNLAGAPAVNLGMTAFTSPTQYARLFAEYGPRLGARRAFFGLFIGNDLGDSENFDTWLLTDKSVSYPEWRTRQIRGIRKDSWPLRMRMLAYQHTALWRTLADRIDFGFSGREKPHRQVVEYQDDALDLVFSKDQLVTDLGPTGVRQAELVRRALRDIRRTGQATGTIPLVFVIPTKELVYQELLASGGEERVSDARYATSLQLLREAEVEFVDLLPVFRRAVAQGADQLYFRVDGHWTPAGHRLAAEAIYARVGETQR